MEDNLQEVKSIEVLNQLIRSDRFNIESLKGRTLLDVPSSLGKDNFYVDSTNINVEMRGYGGGIDYTDDYFENAHVVDLVLVTLSKTLPPFAQLSSRLVLRKGDDAVLGILFAASDREYYLVPASNVGIKKKFQDRSYLEENPEYHAYPDRPVLRYGASIHDPQRKCLTCEFR